MKQETKGRPRLFDRDTVLDGAMEVFWSHGYEASSTEALCARTGLGRGSLYNAFGNKHALYRAALVRYQEKGLAIQTAILEGEGPLKARLRGLLSWGIEGDLNGRERRTCMALFASLERAGQDPVVEKINRSYVAKLEGVLCHQFTLAQRKGELPMAHSALEQARAFLASYYGLRILGTAVYQRDFLQDALEGILIHY